MYRQMAANIGRVRSWRGWTTCLLLVAVITACGGDSGGDHNPGALYPDRANQYSEDQERPIGDAALLGGYTATVTEAGVDADGLMQVHVEITNRDGEPQRIDSTQWTLVNPRIQTLEASAATFPTTELAGGETIKATVTFAVDPGEAAEFYIQFKPEALDAARGIWQVIVP